jgi:hypothetical protein
MLPRIPARHWRQAALTGKRLASAAGAPQRGQRRGDAPAGTPSAKIAALAGQPHAAANSRPEAVRRAGTPGARPWTNRGE